MGTLNGTESNDGCSNVCCDMQFPLGDSMNAVSPNATINANLRKIWMIFVAPLIMSKAVSLYGGNLVASVCNHEGDSLELFIFPSCSSLFVLQENF